MRFLTVLITSCLLFVSCQQQNVYTLDTFTQDGTLHAVIEIPAGTNRKIEYNTNTHDFKVDQTDGQDRVINFLSYPGNYGFIPGTLSNPIQGGDGDALDIIVLCSSLPSQTILEVIPIGLLKLIDDGEEDYKIIAVPSNKALQTIDAIHYIFPINV